MPRASRRLALAAPKSSRACNRVRVKKDPYIAPPFDRAGPQPVYPNELISMYKKVSIAKALLVHGKRSRTSKPSSLDKNLTL